VRALVLEGGGFIGGHVARQLQEAGAELFYTVRRGAAGDLDLRGTCLPLDLSDAGAVARIVSELEPDVVFNLAGYGVDPRERDPQAAAALNAELPRHLALACAGLSPSPWPGLRLVHVGSALEYGTAGGSLSEDTPPRPTTLYGRTKCEGTRRLGELARERGLAAVTARLFTVYGPGEPPGRLLPSLQGAACGGAPLRLTEGRQKRDFTYVEEVAEGLLRLAVARVRPGEVVNLATGTLIPVRHFVRCAAELLGIASGRLDFGALPTRPEEMHHDPVAIDRLRQRTGWVPRCGIRQGIARTLALCAAGAPPRPGAGRAAEEAGT